MSLDLLLGWCFGALAGLSWLAGAFVVVDGRVETWGGSFSHQRSAFSPSIPLGAVSLWNRFRWQTGLSGTNPVRVPLRG